jgi:hypothetical protein
MVTLLRTKTAPLAPFAFERRDPLPTDGTTSPQMLKSSPSKGFNEAFERMLKQEVKYRFVIDMKTL